MKKTGSGEALASFHHVQRVHQPIVPPSQSSGLTHLTSQAHFDLTGNRSQTQAIVAKDAALLAAGLNSAKPHGLALLVVHIGFHLNPDVFGFPISVLALRSLPPPYDHAFHALTENNISLV
jgi:hypothetical protein